MTDPLYLGPANDLLENHVKRQLLVALGLVLCLSHASLTFADSTKEPDHHKEYPRIVKAIHQLQDAIKYMEASPKDFGGHKAEAIADARKAIQSLHLAMGVTEQEHEHHHHH